MSSTLEKTARLAMISTMQDPLSAKSLEKNWRGFELFINPELVRYLQVAEHPLTEKLDFSPSDVASAMSTLVTRENFFHVAMLIYQLKSRPDFILAVPRDILKQGVLLVEKSQHTYALQFVRDAAKDVGPHLQDCLPANIGAQIAMSHLFLKTLYVVTSGKSPH